MANIARGQLVPGVRSYAEGGNIRIYYELRGRPREEEFYAAVSQFVTDLSWSVFTSSYFINCLYIDCVFSFKAHRHGPDLQSKVFQTMVYSIRVNPRWFAKVDNVGVMLAQQAIKGIKATGRIGEMVAQVFADNLGEYVVTDSPGYNPNIGSNLHWEELSPAK